MFDYIKFLEEKLKTCKSEETPIIQAELVELRKIFLSDEPYHFLPVKKPMREQVSDFFALALDP